MSLKARLYSLTFLLHGALLIAAYLYLEEPGYDFIVIEGILLFSLILFLHLVRKILAPFEFVDLFSDVLNEQEFTTRFSDTGNRELDNLMTLFNQMLSQLYGERLKLGDRQGMLQQLMNSIPISILVFDYENKISQVNPAAERLLDIQSAHVSSRYLKSIAHPLVEKLDRLKLGESQLLSDSTGSRYRCQKHDFRDRGFSRQFIFIQELTSELKLSEKRTYEKLIRMMSHEVNNTMAATSSLLRSCLHYSDQIDPEERKDYKNAMHLVIQRTDNLNRFMQDYAQVVRLPKPSFENCNLYHLILSLHKFFEAELIQKNILFELRSFEPNLANIRADQSQLEQALINIIKNSIESIQETTGKIIVEIEATVTNLCLRIKDSGVGISEQSQQNLFTPFYSSKAEGQGIGLMLVQEVFEAHQFSFGLYNRSTEKGACFEVNIPN